MTTDYTAAPATSLIATACACCSRALLDAPSVERGIGPYCAKKHGYGDAQTAPAWDIAQAEIARAVALAPEVPALASLDDARRSANALVHRIAADPQSVAMPHLLAAVSALGYSRLAAAIAEHLCPVTVRIETSADGRILTVRAGELHGDTFDRYVSALRAVPGRWFDRAEKVDRVPTKQKVALWGALKAVFAPGTVIIGQRIAVL